MSEISSPPYTKEHPSSIRKMFSDIARNYDRGNAVLSFGLHRYWNRALIQEVLGSHGETNSGSLLDLCSGTGDIAFSFLKDASQTHEVYLLDFCPDMLAIAKAKSQTPKLQRHSLHFIEGDAQEIPLETSSMDHATVAYGIRNVQSPRRCIAEVYRVLKPGGRFGILELTRPKGRLLSWGHGIYLRGILPQIGRLFLSNQAAYKYLCDSIEAFVSPDALEKVMREVGFRETYQRRLSVGIATLIIGRK